MSKHTPKVFSGHGLANRIAEHEEIDQHDFSMIMDDDGDIVEGAANKWFVVQWPDHCTTEQHLGDAYISDPYATEDEAIADNPGAELY